MINNLSVNYVMIVGRNKDQWLKNRIQFHSQII